MEQNCTKHWSSIEHSQTTEMLGWVICRLKDGDEDLGPLARLPKKLDANPSIFNQIYDLSYGVLSDRDFPPLDSWVFLAKGKY